MAQPLRKTLRTVRELVELTQAEMAQRIGMGEQAYGRFERGSASIVPSASTLRRMYQVLREPLDDLLGPGGSRPRRTVSPRPGSPLRPGQGRRLALRVDLE